ncbi:MAG: GldG family protein [Deltaproteobacteria bacterium]|nr:GldG family protein [Deltaproteobacteria bacterium]
MSKATSKPSQWLERLAGAPTAALLALVLFGIINVLAARHYRRFDWTRAGLFTLSPRSQQVARSTREPVEIVVLLGRAEAQWRDAVELAERYRALTPKITVRTLDPDRQREAFVAFAQRYGLRATRSSTSDVAAEAGIVIVRGERHLEIKRDQLAALGDAVQNGADRSAADRIASARVTVERALTSALVAIARTDRPTLCVSKGHDEVPMSGTDESMQLFVQDLEHDNITAREVTIRGATAVPADCDALLIAGPRQAFTEGEAARVLRYARAGGNLLVLLDPNFVERRHAQTGLESVLREAGIEATRSVVVESDPEHLLENLPPMVFTAGDFGAHEISRNLRGIDAQVLVRTARALQVLPAANSQAESLLRTTPSAWGETGELEAVRDGALRRDGADITGPIDLALASRFANVRPRVGHRANGRIAVFSFSYLVTNEAMSLGFRARFADAALLQAAVGWLLERDDLVDVPPRPANSSALLISQESIKLIRWYALGLVPLAAILVGVAVLRARKSVE